MYAARMPGFNAERSLSPTSRQYCVTSRGSSTPGGVLPQLVRNPWADALNMLFSNTNPVAAAVAAIAAQMSGNWGTGGSSQSPIECNYDCDATANMEKKRCRPLPPEDRGDCYDNAELFRRNCKKECPAG